MPEIHVHIGHHFFGAGNVGDDLMLEGFLVAARGKWLDRVKLTCCSAHDRESQKLRFPEVEWLPYDPGTRAACIERCDVWLGLGDTPFQATGGNTWFLDHLCEEAAWCRQFGVPMFYLGVGVNEREIVNYPQMRALVGQAEKIWMRDDISVEMLYPLTVSGQAAAYGDLAHIALAGMNFRAPDAGALGFVLNFEDAGQFRIDQLASLILQSAGDWRPRWLAQEIRPLTGSETLTYGQLPPGARGKAPLCVPDYARGASGHALLEDWEGLEALFASRYHASLIGAWMGARVVVFARNDKVAGAARQLGLATVLAIGDADAILEAVRTVVPVERALLMRLAARSRLACEEFFAVADAVRLPVSGALWDGGGLSKTPIPADIPFVTENPQMSDKPSTRILFLRPDAYGDLFLFEFVPRLVRHLWPHAEIGVLIRKRYEDIVPLIASEGVRWLTTDCDAYREAPGDNPAALNALRETVTAFAPDCVVAACSEQTWLESAVAASLPGVRQVSIGPGLTDPLARAALDAVLPVDWAAIHPEKIPVEPELHEWEKNLRLVSALTGQEAPRWWPTAHVPLTAREEAARILADAGLEAGKFVVCAAAGTANVPIKSWPAEYYAATLAWLQNTHGIRALLIGHETERAQLEAVCGAARSGGADPALWLGRDGEMPVAAGLLDAARFYFGNDTGALHLAAALGRPVLPIYGGGTWPRFQPVARRSLSVVQPLPCFGCAWDCYFVDAPCIRTISPESVREALEMFLHDDEDGQSVFEAKGLEAGARELIDTAIPRLRFLREDSTDRLRQVRQLTVRAEDLSRQLQASDADRDARRFQIEELTAQIKESEADRHARLSRIDELGARLKASEADREARLKQIERLTEQLRVSEADRGARGLQVEELTAQLKASEADRDARFDQIEELTAQLKASEADRDARFGQIEELTAQLKASEADRDARFGQIEELTAQLKASEADRDARFGQIEELTAQLQSSELDRTARFQQLEAFSVRLKEIEADSHARFDQIVGLTALLKASEADRDARGKLLGEMAVRIETMQIELDRRDGQEVPSVLTFPSASGTAEAVATGGLHSS